MKTRYLNEKDFLSEIDNIKPKNNGKRMKTHISIDPEWSGVLENIGRISPGYAEEFVPTGAKSHI